MMSRQLGLDSREDWNAWLRETGWPARRRSDPPAVPVHAGATEPAAVSPTGLLMGAMLKYGLRPGGIVWDHEPHRFPGKEKPASNRSGWYVAFADRRGAVFGDYSQGLRQHWRLDHDGPFDRQDRERWRAERRKRAKERAEKAAIALEAMREAWDEASDTVDHPYLERKGIDEPVGGIRQHGETLFIPAYEDDGTLSNVQRIYYDRDGKQQKRFWKGRSSKGCRLTLAGARFAATNTLNLCEGYATAYSIHKATNEAVVVAFNDHGLVEVGRSLRAKYPDAKIVVCADNDQWSTILRGKEELPNPGVVYAQEACEAIGGVLRIPQFEDLGTKPTDFDDLRQLEGIPAVRHWLENEPPEATPVAGEVEERIESDREDWRETAPFRCLGYNEGRYLYLPKTTGQVESITKRSHSMPSYLLALHDEIAWWARHWPGPNRSTRPVNWYQAMVGLMGECHRQGVFVTENLRGIGAWRDESGGVVLHLGDRLLPPGEKKYVLPETFEDGARVYPRLPRVIGPATDKAMPLQEARNIYELFTKDLLWEDPASGMLLAGFTVLAAFCGALAWRPSVWLTGSQGCGKSTIQEHIVKPLLGGMCKQYQGGTTEAAIRQTIQADALPVLYDEAERDGIKAKQQMDAVIRLIRTSASTGGDVVKGSPTGKAVTYKARSMFCLAAIGGGLTEEADKARITILPLKSKYVVPEDVRSEAMGPPEEEDRVPHPPGGTAPPREDCEEVPVRGVRPHPRSRQGGGHGGVRRRPQRRPVRDPLRRSVDAHARPAAQGGRSTPLDAGQRNTGVRCREPARRPAHPVDAPSVPGDRGRVEVRRRRAGRDRGRTGEGNGTGPEGRRPLPEATGHPGRGQCAAPRESLGVDQGEDGPDAVRGVMAKDAQDDQGGRGERESDQVPQPAIEDHPDPPPPTPLLRAIFTSQQATGHPHT